MQLLGLKWAGASRRATEAGERRLLQLQREDGSWGQTADLASDAYATGETLYTLHELGVSVKRPGIPPRRAVSVADPGGRRQLVREEPRGEVPAVFRDQLPILRRSVDLDGGHELGGDGVELRQWSAATGTAVKAER